MIVVIAAISFLFSEWGWCNKATANFYLAPTSAWELFSGSIAAFIVQNHGIKKNNPLSLVGLATITFAVFFYDKTTPFPSAYTLLPVLGAVLLILYAEKETIAAKLLSTEGFVRIGLTSYSAYLWHQPLFAFARIRSSERPSLLLMLVLSFLSLFLAYFSWQCVEKRFCKKQHINRKAFSFLLAISLSGFLLIGLVGHLTDGHFRPLTDAQHQLIRDNEQFFTKMNLK